MHATRTNRLLTALVVLFSLLFTQLAVAAYACPDMAPVKAAVMLDATGQPMQDCPMNDRDSPSLCGAHAKASPLSVDKAEPAPIAPFMASALLAVIAMPAEAIDSSLTLLDDSMRPRGAAPPIPILHCCFRI